MGLTVFKSLLTFYLFWTLANAHIFFLVDPSKASKWMGISLILWVGITLGIATSTVLLAIWL